jgi:hypothetical protein
MKYFLFVLFNFNVFFGLSQNDSIYYMVQFNFSLATIDNTSYTIIDDKNDTIEQGKLISDALLYFQKFGDKKIIEQDKLQLIFISRILNKEQINNALKFRLTKLSENGMFIHNIYKDDNLFYIVTNQYDNSFDMLGSIIKTDTTYLNENHYKKITRYYFKEENKYHILSPNSESWEPIIYFIEYIPNSNITGFDYASYLRAKHHLLKLNKYVNKLTKGNVSN